MFIYKIKNYKIQKLKEGFTLIELLVTLALASIVAVAGITLLGGYNAGRNLKSEGQQFIAALQNAQQNSQGQQNGTRWGVRASNTTSTQSYMLFSGLNYASGTVANTYAFRSGVQFGNPSVSSTIDAIFNPITGYLPSPQVFTLNDGKGDGLIYDVVMDTIGKISGTYDTGLVGYWHFDENTSSTVYDASGKGNSGTLYNNPVWQSGSNCEAGSCLGLNGSNMYISVPNNQQLQPSKISIAYWVRFNSFADSWQVSNNPNPFDYNHGYMIREDTPTNTIGFYIGYGTSNAGIWSGALITGTWYYVVGTYDGSILRLYINGNQIGSGTTVNQPINYTGVVNSLYFGQRSDNALRLNGSMDEVHIYNRALTAQEILDQYNNLQ